MPDPSKQRHKTDVHQGSLEAASWLESKVSEREFKDFQAFVRGAMDRLSAEFSAYQNSVGEKIKEMEERLDAVEYAEDLSNGSEIYGENDDEEEAGESSSSSSSSESSDSGDSDSDHAENYDSKRFEAYNQPQQGPYAYPWEQKKMSFPA
jgi:hypothetical protein